MSFFGEDDDPFESLFGELLGNRAVRRGHSKEFISSEEEDRNTDFMEDNEFVYILFEVPGFSYEDIKLNVKGFNLEIYAKKNNLESIEPYLKQKLSSGFSIQKRLPNLIDPKKYSYTLKNGILEITFNKKRGKR